MLVIIETPRGSAEKYSYDPVTGFFKLKKILPAGMAFPYDFGFFPGTKAEDGDPLDVIVLCEFHSFPGVMMDCRVIGGIKAVQSASKKKKVRNDRLFAIPEQSSVYKDINTMKQLPDRTTGDIIDFFTNYNKIEGKLFEPVGTISIKEAEKIIKKSHHG